MTGLSLNSGSTFGEKVSGIMPNKSRIKGKPAYLRDRPKEKKQGQGNQSDQKHRKKPPRF